MANTGRTTPTSPRSKATTKPKAHFSVAAAEAELDLDEVEPFIVEHPRGHFVTFKDPRTIGYIQASGMDPRNAIAMFSELIEDRDEYKKFVSEDIPQPVVQEMFDNYRDHYGIADLGN